MNHHGKAFELTTLRRNPSEPENESPRGKQAARDIREREERYRTLLETMEEGYYEVDLRGNFTFVNDSMCRIHQTPREELLGVNNRDYMDPATARNVYRIFNRVYQTGQPVKSLEWEIVKKDGSRAVEESSVYLMRDAEGRAVGFRGIVRDVTERKRMEEALRQREERFRLVAEDEGAWVWEVDTEGRYTYASPVVEKVLGYRPEEIVGKKYYYDLMSPDRREELKKSVAEIFRRRGVIRNLLNLNVHKDGRLIYLETKGSPIVDVQGNLRGYRGVDHDVTERKQAEDLYRTLTDSSQVGIYIMQDGQFRFMNPRFRSYFGESLGEPQDVEHRAIPHSEDRKKVERNAAQVLQGGRMMSYEYRIIDSDGKTRWVLERITPISYEGRPAVLANNVDITELKEVEEALRRSEEEAKRLAREAAVLAEIGRIISSTLKIEEVYDQFAAKVAQLLPLDRISIHVFHPVEDLAGIVYVSGADVADRRGGDSYAMSAMTREMMRSRKSLLIQTDDPAEVARHSPQLLSTLAAGLRSMVSVPLISNDQVIGVMHIRSRKREAYTENHVRLAERVGDQIAGAIANALLFAQRQDAESALRESEEKYRLVVQNANDAIMVAQDGAIKFSNAKTEELTGYSAAELAEIPFVQHIHPEDRESFLQRNRDRRTGKTGPGSSFRIRNKSGGEIWVELNSVAILWDGKPATLNFLRNITDQKTLESQFLQSQKMEAIGRLAGGIAHDFNNLLTIVNTHAQLGLSEAQEGDPLRDKFDAIQKAGERAANLTRQLLAFSRRQQTEMKVIDLNEVLIDLEKMLGRILGEDIELLCVLDRAPGMVKADPTQIEQVILNLVVNARDAMPTGGKLTIETKVIDLTEEYAYTHLGMEPGRYVMLSVSDTGIGMAPETRERIFEPFFTTKEMGKGTGLGLSTVYGIIRQSRGHIWVYSEPGGGTTLKIYLPRADENASRSGAKLAGQTASGGNETILVVEDEEEVRLLAVQILRQHGYHVLEAANGGDALLLCEQWKEPIDLLLADVVMPEINGPDLARRLKFIRPEVQIVFMSGYTDNAILQNGVMESRMLFLQKPFTIQTLARIVREALDKRS